jgi:hypothetical protein
MMQVMLAVIEMQSITILNGSIFQSITPNFSIKIMKLQGVKRKKIGYQSEVGVFIVRYIKDLREDC